MAVQNEKVLPNYSKQLKTRMTIYNLIGKADIWWQDIKWVKGIKKKNINWSTFKNYFKNNLFSKQYYEEWAKEFYDLRLRTMSIKKLKSKFLSLLHYVPYIVDEKPKVRWFLSCLSFHIKDIIEYNNPKTLEEAMRKENFCQSRNEKGRTCQTGKQKGLMILNKERNVSHLIEILGIINNAIF